jgi:hypothetical protein
MTANKREEGRRISKKELLYLSWQPSEKTWRQFWNEIYGDCHWMATTQYGGDWLDKKMNEPIDERRITRSTE